MTTTTDLKLTANQTAVLDYFDTEQAGTVQDIATWLGKKPGALTAVLGSLVKRGLLHVIPGVGAEDGMNVFTRPESITVAHDAPAAHSVGITVSGDVASALTKARDLADAGGTMEFTKSGYARTITIGKAYVTRDGAFIAAHSTLESTQDEAWALYRTHAVDTVDAYVTLVGTFKTSVDALAARNLA